MSSKTPIARSARNKMDSDYLHKLNDEELAWLQKFNSEYYQAYFRKNTDALHQSPEARRAIYSNINAARRDIWNVFFCLQGEMDDHP